MPASLTHLRRVAAVTLAVVVVVAVAGIGKLQLNSHYTAYFDSDDPLLLAHREIAARYARHDSVFVVLQSADSFLGSRNYRLLEDLTGLLAAMPSVTSALSITELGIVGEVPGEAGETLPAIGQLREQGRAIGLLLAENARLAGILLQVDLSDTRSAAVLDALGAIRRTVDDAVADAPVSAHYSGALALNEAYIRVVRDDLARIVPLLLLVMTVALGWLLRSPAAVATMLPVGILSVLAAFGFAGLLRVELTALHSFTPVILLSISLAGCVHMALAFKRCRDRGLPAGDAAIAAARYNLLPMSLANGTTAFGFLGLLFSPSPPVRLVGCLVAAGIAISFVLCMTLLPVLQARFDPWQAAPGFGSGVLDRLTAFVNRRRTGIVAVAAILAVPATMLASRNVVSDNVFEYFVPSHEFYRDTQLVERELSGVNEMLYSLGTGRASGFFEARAFDTLARFSDWLERQPEVRRVTSIADTGIIAEAMLEGRLQQRLDFYRERIGESAATNPLLALEVSDDYSSSLVSVFLEHLDSRGIVDFDRRVHAWAAQNLDGYALQSGGPTLLFANLGEQNIRGMLTALTIALFGAALLLGAVLRSRRVAGIGLVCNLLPVLLVFSVWAVADGRISIGAAVVMGMILGIVLDDTIYLLTACRDGLRDTAADPAGHALQRVGPALIVTTITLMAGLSTGMLSEFGPIWSMSVLSVMIIGVALIVDLILLPALLPVRTSRSAAT